MVDLSSLIGSVLDENEATLRRAAKQTIASMRPEAKFSELLESDAAATIRSLSLRELADALRPLVNEPSASPGKSSATQGSAKAQTASSTSESEASTQDRNAELFRDILEILVAGPLTIGQLARRLDLETAELRGYLQWMIQEGKITRSGKARATRYQLAE